MQQIQYGTFMNLNKLKESLADFRSWLERQRQFEPGPHWETLQQFQQNWDVDAPDLAEMYDHCLQNNRTKRLWKQEAWEPKQMMMTFARMQPEFLRRMFKDLFDESKDLTGRISRFKFGMDTLLAEYKERHPRRIDNNHYHDDSRMVHLYLALRFPAKYTPFDYPAFRKMTELLLIKEPPSPFETDRFLKITKIWRTFLEKDNELAMVFNRKYPQQYTYEKVVGMLTFDFYQSLTSKVSTKNREK